jgi:uncharacterized protein YndB with AHSA1/START domain
MKYKYLYSIEREFDCDLETLWEAWTSAAALERWYCPTVLEVIPGSATSLPVVGGRWAIAVDVSANGFNAYFWGRYLEVVPSRRLVHSLSFSQDEAEFIFADDNAPAHRIELDFDSRGDRAWVKLTQFGDLPEEQIEATSDGMESYFDNLEVYLASK